MLPTASQYVAIVDGLVEILKATGEFKAVLDYDAGTIPSSPALCLIFDEYDSTLGDPTGGQMANTWRLAARLYINYGGNEKAEQQIKVLVPLVIETVAAHLSANGAIAEGHVLVTRAKGGYVKVANVLYRIVTFTFEATEHVPFGYAL